MKNPIQVFVGSLDLAAVHSVTQRIYMVNEDEKMDMVSSILKALNVLRFWKIRIWKQYFF